MEFIDLTCLAGIILLAIWLLKTSLGARALADSVPRRNNMPLYLPFIPLFIWFVAVSLVILIANKLAGDLQNWQSEFLDNLILCIGGLTTAVVIILLARNHFARRLKGFGLNVKTIHKDFFAAFVNLLTIWPLMMAAMILTIAFGKLFWGQEYQIQQHQELELIMEYSQLPLRILIIVVAVVIAPVLEEMLFRGLFQTIIRSFLETRPLVGDHQSGPSISGPPFVSAKARAVAGEADIFRPSNAGSNFDQLRADDSDSPIQNAPCSVGSNSPEPTAAVPGRDGAIWTSNGAWLAILISSGLFAIVHTNPGHWPALFVLAVCLGYAYEKSGSLFRPIFIHSLFNAASIIATLSQ
jgi:membrane protease YdiL (CAAX protease family)